MSEDAGAVLLHTARWCDLHPVILIKLFIRTETQLRLRGIVHINQKQHPANKNIALEQSVGTSLA